MVTAPIHRIIAHPHQPYLYLFNSNFVHKYDVKSSSLVGSYTFPAPESYAQFIDFDENYLYVTGGDKFLRILDAQTLDLEAELYIIYLLSKPSFLIKRASALSYSTHVDQVFVADRTGDVYAFPWPLKDQLLYDKFIRIKSLPPPDDKKPLTKDSDERFMGTLLLSHSSSVLACTIGISPLGSYTLVTGDRDEHVRISHYPETFIIHAMGMGHSAMVTSVVSIKYDGGDRYITGGGDEIILWDFYGKVRAKSSISSGGCVRLLRRWKDYIIAVGERYFLFVSF
jgi:WD40 repeat protein